MLHSNIDKLKQYRNKGYIVVYYPSHPNSWSGCGLFFYHRLVMENHLGRLLNSSEVVHHTNGDILDNSLGNLELCSNRSHSSSHTKKRNKELGLSLVPIKCKQCKKVFQPNNGKRQFCSTRCSARSQEKAKWPSDNALKKLVWSIPSTKVAKKIGVSDKAVEKRCKSRGIEKPPRGYWMKKKQ